MWRQKRHELAGGSLSGKRWGSTSHTSRIIQFAYSNIKQFKFRSASPTTPLLPRYLPGLNLPSMMSCSRRLTSLASVRPRFAIRTYTSTVPRLHENRMQPNDPSPPASKPNVSGTNAPDSQATAPIAKLVEMENTFVEDPAVGEQIRSLQAPNRATTWAASQQPREQAMTGPRFEQTIMETQVCE